MGQEVSGQQGQGQESHSEEANSITNVGQSSQGYELGRDPTSLMF